MAFKIVNSDLSSVSAAAVVLPSNPSLIIDGGAGAAVAAKAGLAAVQAACANLGGCKPGQAKVTPAFGFPATYLFHAVGPVWQGGEFGEAGVLRQTYQSVLRLAVDLDCDSIALPLLSSGAYGFPADLALSIASECLGAFCESSDIEVTLCLLEDKASLVRTRLYEGVNHFVDRHLFDGAQSRLISTPEAMPSAASKCDSIEMEKATATPASERANRRQALSLPLFSRKKKTSAASAPMFDEHAEMPSFSAERDFSAALDEPAAYEAESFSGSCHLCGTRLPKDAKFCFACGAAQRKLVDVDLEGLLQSLDESFSVALLRLIDASGLTDAQVYRRANMSRQLFSKIRSNPDYKPKKATVVSLCVALRLTLSETKDLLSRAGYSLTHASKFDIIIEYFITQQIYDMITINAMLYAYDQELLGN